MYLKFFNFKEEPFSVTPDPKFFYWSHQHEAATESLLYGISQRKGFLLLTGEIGTGKTTLCRSLMNRLDPKTEVSVILNPLLSVAGILRAINEDFGNPIKLKGAEYQMEGLNRFLLSQANEGKNAAVLIDEAQNLSVQALETIRLLSNLETDKQKLLQILLVGQPELETKLQSHQLRQLNQRISIRQRLGVLNFAESKSYIFHRLSVAGGEGNLCFEPNALKQVYEFSAGYPRVMNILCDRVLLTAYSRQTRIINKRIVREGIADLGERTSKSWWRVW